VRIIFLTGSILLFIGFIIYQIGMIMSLKSEELIRGTLTATVSMLPAGTEIFSNSILVQSLGGVIAFIGILLCASSLAKTAS
jgi:hypothetical protein